MTFAYFFERSKKSSGKSHDSYFIFVNVYNKSFFIRKGRKFLKIIKEWENKA